MGQQQLLLLIMTVIIVSVATVIAANLFSNALESANLEAINKDLATVGAQSQAYYVKSTILGGGGGEFTNLNFFNITFPADSITPDGMIAINANAEYEINLIFPWLMQIRATPANGHSTVERIDALVYPDGIQYTVRYISEQWFLGAEVAKG